MKRKDIIITSLFICGISLVPLVWTLVDIYLIPSRVDDVAFGIIFTIIVLLILITMLIANLSTGPRNTMKKIHEVFKQELKTSDNHSKRTVYMEFTIENGEIISFHKGPALGDCAEKKEGYVNFLQEF